MIPWRREVRMEVASGGDNGTSMARSFAAMHCARDSWMKPQPNGGFSSGSDEEPDSEETAEKRAMASWRRTPSLSTSQMYDLPSEASELLPLPIPVAPSSGEVKLALWARGGQRGQPGPDQVESDEQVVAVISGIADGVNLGRCSEPNPTPEPPIDDRDARLVLPALESLICMRRDRLSRQRSSSQLQQRQPEPNIDSETVWRASAATGSGTGATRPFRQILGMIASKAIPVTRVPEHPALPSSAQSLPGGSPTGITSAIATKSVQPPLSQFPGPWRATRKWPGLGKSSTGGADPTSAPGATTSVPGPTATISMSDGGTAEPLVAASSQSFTAGYTPQSGTTHQQVQRPPQEGDLAVSPPVTETPRLLRFSPRPLSRIAQQNATADYSANAAARGDVSGSCGGGDDEECVDSPQKQREQLQQWHEWRQLARSQEGEDRIAAADARPSLIAQQLRMDGAAANTPGIGPQAMPLWLSSSVPTGADTAGGAPSPAGVQQGGGAGGRSGRRAPPSRTSSFIGTRGAGLTGRLLNVTPSMHTVSCSQLELPTEFEQAPAGQPAARAAAAALALFAPNPGSNDVYANDATASDLQGKARPLHDRTPGSSNSADGRSSPAAALSTAGPSRLGLQQPSLPLQLRQQSRPMRPSARSSVELPLKPQLVIGPTASARASLEVQRSSAGRFSFEARGGSAVFQQRPQQDQAQQPAAFALPQQQPESRQQSARQDASSGQGQGSLLVTNSFKVRRPDPFGWSEGLLP